ncbi:MAG: hypothetical protein KIS29_05420 [Thermoplasmata archaeon]|jgi:hypothetical protein|nr:hypothetical protein [Candidatus Sysuiplasma jiujiangense]
MSEKTTLLASKTTKQYLELVKDETGLQSYDEVIDFLLKTSKRLAGSEKGRLPKLKTFRREEGYRTL